MKGGGCIRGEKEKRQLPETLFEFDFDLRFGGFWLKGTFREITRGPKGFTSANRGLLVVGKGPALVAVRPASPGALFSLVTLFVSPRDPKRILQHKAEAQTGTAVPKG